MTYTVTIPQLGDLQDAFARMPGLTKTEVTKAVNRSLVSYQGTAKQLAPIDTGLLRSMILIEPARWTGNTVRGAVNSGAPYALEQEVGTGIYGPRKTPIRPRSKPVLSWYSGGKWHFAKEVRGSRPRWYMRGSFEQNQSNTEANFQLALDNVTQALAKGGR